MAEAKKPSADLLGYPGLASYLLVGRRPVGEAYFAFRGDRALSKRLAVVARKHRLKPSQLMRGLILYALDLLERGEIQVTAPQEVLVTRVQRP
jgi:hypothetical protein